MGQLKKTSLGKPQSLLIEAASAIGLDFAGLTHEITDHFKNHVIKRHGNQAKHGAATVTKADFERIPAILETPDVIIIGAERQKRLYNIYAKIENGMTIFYFEEILNSKRNKALRSCTFYKITRPLSLSEIIKILTRNDKTEISTAKIVTR